MSDAIDFSGWIPVHPDKAAEVLDAIWDAVLAVLDDYGIEGGTVGGHNAKSGWKPRLLTLRGSAAVPGRCWRLTWRDRMAWRVFALLANRAVAWRAWLSYRDDRRAIYVERRFTSGHTGRPALFDACGPPDDKDRR